MSEEKAEETPAHIHPTAEDVAAWHGYQLDEITGQGVAKVERNIVEIQVVTPAIDCIKR